MHYLMNEKIKILKKAIIELNLVLGINEQYICFS